jgi:ADP-heptose:LPS heptosyltransferase
MEDVLKAFPVVAALREKHRTAEIVWLTSAKHSSLARASLADGVCEFEPVGAIPWDWAAIEGYTHIFHPVTASHLEQKESEPLHLIDLMAKKCGVTLESRKPWLEPGKAALLEAESFLSHCGLSRKSYLTIYHAGELRRFWPSHNLHRLATAIGLPIVVIGEAGEFATAGTIPCFGRSTQVVAALIRWSAFYMGPDFGVSWIASTCGTPMGIFIGSSKDSRNDAGIVEILTQEKEDVIEWSSQTNTESIIEHIASKLLAMRSIASQGDSTGVPLR